MGCDVFLFRFSLHVELIRYRQCYLLTRYTINNFVFLLDEISQPDDRFTYSLRIPY